METKEEAIIRTAWQPKKKCKHDWEKLKKTEIMWFLFIWGKEESEYLICKKCGRKLG